MIDFNKFNNFLKSEDLYNENVELYDKLIHQITNDVVTEWVITKFANGKPMADGNPIYSAFIPTKKIAVRIIQTKTDINKPIFNTWINNNPFEIVDVKELVISLQLRQDTYEDLSYLLELFINKTVSNKITKFLNDKYHKIWNEQILRYTIKTRRENKISEILNKDFSNDDFTVDKLKSYAFTVRNIFPIFLVDYKFSNNNLNISIKGLKSATDNLYTTLTINNNIGIKNKKSTISHLISSHYSNFPNYRKRLKKNKDKFREELDEIEQIIR